jgi:hypothetical protein
MGDDIGGYLLLVVGAGLLVAPAAFLVLGWRALRARRYGRADTWATLAAMASVGQCVLVGGFALLAVCVQDASPSIFALLLVPGAFRFLAGLLERTVRARRGADRVR